MYFLLQVERRLLFLLKHDVGLLNLYDFPAAYLLLKPGSTMNNIVHFIFNYRFKSLNGMLSCTFKSSSCSPCCHLLCSLKDEFLSNQSEHFLWLLSAELVPCFFHHRSHSHLSDFSHCIFSKHTYSFSSCFQLTPSKRGSCQCKTYGFWYEVRFHIKLTCSDNIHYLEYLIKAFTN